MANQPRPIDQINAKPGFARDGTQLDNNSFIDGQWCRFQRGRPKKIGGYKAVSENIADIVRGAYVYTKGTLNFLYGFARNKAYISVTNQTASTSVASASTLPDNPTDDDFSFSIDAIYDSTGSGAAKLLVHPAHNLTDIADETNTNIYMADVGSAPGTFVKIVDEDSVEIKVSGGVVVLQPYVFAYGNNGLIKNSAANNPNAWKISLSSEANEVNVSGTKVVKGLPLRGGAASPSGLFWSLDSLIKVSRSGTELKYDTVSAEISVLSPQSIIEYDGVYYWIGVDRFLVYDGTVKEVPNQQNMNWFFDNLNYAQRTKVWAKKNTRYGEIWWYFPFGDAEECTHALIYNIRENCWYDTVCPRSAGYSARVFRYPVSYGTTPNEGGAYPVYVDEFGKNAVEGGAVSSVPSWFETCDFGYPTGGASGEKPTGDDYWTRLIRVEPDFILSGAMNMYVRGKEFAQGPITESSPHTFYPETERIDLREQRRQITLKFVSNAVDGDYLMGRVILHTEHGDIRS